MPPDSSTEQLPVTLKAEHVAAKIVSKDFQSPNTEVVRLRDLPPRDMFRLETGQELKEPAIINWNEIQKVVDTEPVGTQRHTYLQKLRGDLENILSGETVRITASVKAARAISDVPGFAEVISTTLNGAATPESIRAFLKGNNAAVDAQWHAPIRGLIEYQLRQPEFRDKLARTLADIKLQEDFDSLETQAQRLPELRQREQRRVDEIRTVLEPRINTFEARPDARDARNRDDELKRLLENIKIEYRPEGFVDTNYNAQITNANTTIASNEDIMRAIRARANITNRDLELITKYENENVVLRNTITAIERARTYMRNNRDLIQSYREAQAAIRRQEELQNELNSIRSEITSIAGTDRKRETMLNDYKARLENALKRTSQGYWDEVVLRDAREIAAADAKRATEDKTKETTKQESADKLLAGFLESAMFKYDRKDHIKGLDRKWLKRMTKSIKANGPAEMGRLLLERVNQQSSHFPPAERERAQKLLKDIMDASGTQFEISNDALANITANHLIKVGGRAEATGLWFSKTKFTDTEAEFLERNYGKDFWDKVIAHSEEYDNSREARAKKGMLGLRASIGRSMRKLLPQDWKSAVPRLLLLAGGLGLAAGAGPGMVNIAANLVGLGAAVTRHMANEVGKTLATAAQRTGEGLAAVSTGVDKALNTPIISTEVTPNGIIERIGPSQLQEAQKAATNLGTEIGKKISEAGALVGQATATATNVTGETFNQLGTAAHQAVENFQETRKP